jgi:hypothetical protein
MIKRKEVEKEKMEERWDLREGKGKDGVCGRNEKPEMNHS